MRNHSWRVIAFIFCFVSAVTTADEQTPLDKLRAENARLKAELSAARAKIRKLESELKAAPEKDKKASGKASTQEKTMRSGQSDSKDRKNPADAMRELRRRTLTTPAAELGIEKSKEFPSVYGILMEFPLGEHTATVVSLCDGNASLYTTSTFGVVGGIAHEDVRTAAISFVKTASEFANESIPADEYPYPAPDRVRFYFLTFSGARVIDTDLATLETGKNRFSKLFGVGQETLARLRETTQKKGSQE